MSSNPGGGRKALAQDEHERINARSYPGTRQLCANCDEPTGRCEEDEMRTDLGDGPYCEACFELVLVPLPNSY